MWPSYANIPNTLPSSMPTTTSQFVGFIVFWTLSLPFLFIRPERFKLPFQVVSIYCGVGMMSMSRSLIIVCFCLTKKYSDLVFGHRQGGWPSVHNRRNNSGWKSMELFLAHDARHQPNARRDCCRNHQRLGLF
jgi:cytosine/uracil/thiamine/allantoin permease